MHQHVRLFLQSRIRLAQAEEAHTRPHESPLSEHANYVPGPFLLSSVPRWAADLLASDDFSHQSIELVWRHPATQATYILHVLQAGPLQLRTLLPSAAPGVRKLLEHAAAHQTLNLVFDIEESTQALDFLVVFDRQAALKALAAPQLRTSEAVQDDEAELLLSLVREVEVPSLVADCPVREALVVFAGETARLRFRSPAALASSGSSALH